MLKVFYVPHRDKARERHTQTRQCYAMLHHTTLYHHPLHLMPHTTSHPLREIRIVRRREEPPIRLLARQSLLLGRYDTVVPLRLRLAIVVAAPPLLGLLHFAPVVRLALLAVVDEEGEGGGEADDDEAFEDALVEVVVVVVVVVGVGAGHAVVGEGIVVGVVVVIVGAVVVGVGLFEEVGDPFAQGPFFFGFCCCC